jgi:hypothetical protein
MLIINTNRTRIFIQCKHPEYGTDVKVQYHCNNQTNQWELNYENKKLICRKLRNFYKKNLMYFI